MALVTRLRHSVQMLYRVLVPKGCALLALVSWNTCDMTVSSPGVTIDGEGLQACSCLE